MDPWSKLAEARIQEWLRKPERERQTSHGPPAADTPLEVQLLSDARTLYEQARETQDPREAEQLRTQAAQLETRILVLLEDSGRPLAAQRFAQMLADARTGRSSEPNV